MIRHKIPFLLFLLFSFSSCDDFLDVEPEFEISIPQQLSSKAGVIQALRGTYDVVNTVFFTENAATYGDLLAGNLGFAPNVVNRIVEVRGNADGIYSFNDFAEASDMVAFYTNAYRAVANANQILEFVDALPDATQDEINQIKAECYGIRAYVYFRLAQLYVQPHGFTPNNTHPGLVVSEVPLIVGEDFPARATAADTFTFIERDILRALDNQRGINLFGLEDIFSFRETAVRAIYADFALWTKDWQQAFEQSNRLITSSGITLQTNSDTYVSDWLQEGEPSETLFAASRTFDEADGTVNFDATQFFTFFNTSSYRRNVASGDLRAIFETNDVRASSLFLEVDIPTQEFGVTTDRTYFFTQKYQASKGLILYRISEMYLIRAEAQVRLNNLEMARGDVNQIKLRSGATALSNNESLLQEIWDERRRELAFEGKTFFDFARTGRNITRTVDCIADQCNLTFPNPKFVLPIPNQTIVLNPNLIQNEGY